MRYWVVCQTQPQREQWAAENIRRQGVDCYLPLISTVIVRQRKRITTAKPLFPRYVFAHIVGPWRFLLGTYGVSNVLLDGDIPAKLPESIVRDLRSREHHGLVQLPEGPVSRFRSGQTIRIRSGMFQGYVGVYDGMASKDRERVLLKYLGRETPVLIAEGALEAPIKSGESSG